MKLFKNWQVKILIVFVLIGMVPVATAPTADRGYVAARYGLELDGQFAGWLYSAEGGDATADVVIEASGTNLVAKKHISGVKYDDINITAGTGMSNGFYTWIQDTFKHNFPRKSGAIILVDYNRKEISRLNFYNALITEVGMPELDAASKDAAKMTIRIRPENTQKSLASKGNTVGSLFDARVQKRWLPSNFRLKIDGLESSTNRVNKIKAITVKVLVDETQVGAVRDVSTEPGRLEFSNIVLTVAESNAQPFQDWHEDFVINGNSGDDKEKGGTLEYLTPNLQETLFTLTFEHLGIFKLTPEKVESGSGTIRRVKAEMYVENIKFDFR